VCACGRLLLDEWPVKSNEALEKLTDDPAVCSVSWCTAPGVEKLTFLLAG